MYTVSGKKGVCMCEPGYTSELPGSISLYPLYCDKEQELLLEENNALDRISILHYSTMAVSLHLKL